MASSQDPEDPEARGGRRALEARGAWRMLVANEIRRLEDQLELVDAPAGLEKITPDGRERRTYVKRQKTIVGAHLDRAVEAIASTPSRSAIASRCSG